ncbi:hypothetical protein ACHAQA_007693 [Verticillium albo-atrum]
MATLKPNDVPDIKATVEKREHIALKSDHDKLSLRAFVWRFKKAMAIYAALSDLTCKDNKANTGAGRNIIANQGFINHIGFPNREGVYALNARYTALWGAMQSLGQIVGMLSLNPVSDRIGRKPTLYVLWVILAASIAIETAVRDWKDWAGAKLLAGIGIGALQATLPVYITEWSPVNIRGAMVLTYGFWNTIGNFLAPMILTVMQASNPLDYKTPILIQWGFLGLMLPIFIWLPETPAYYAERDQDELGKKTLNRINGGIQDYDVETERLTFISAIACALTMIVVGILGFVNKTTVVLNLLIFIACVWAFFNKALGSLGWAFVGEVASQKLRARTAGVAAASSVVFGLTFNTTVPLMLDINGVNWGYKTAWLFSGTGLITIVVVFFYVPEPSQRNSAEMDEMYEKGIAARKMRKYVTDVQRAAYVHTVGV